jgi:hypothetical protein
MNLKMVGAVGVAFFWLGNILATNNSNAQMLSPGYGTMGAPMSNFINSNYLLNNQLKKGPSTSYKKTNSGNRQSASSSRSSFSSGDRDLMVDKLAALFEQMPAKRRPTLIRQIRASVMNTPQFKQASRANQQLMLRNLSSLVEEAVEEANDSSDD